MLFFSQRWKIRFYVYKTNIQSQPILYVCNKSSFNDNPFLSMRFSFIAMNSVVQTTQPSYFISWLLTQSQSLLMAEAELDKPSHPS